MCSAGQPKQAADSLGFCTYLRHLRMPQWQQTGWLIHTVLSEKIKRRLWAHKLLCCRFCGGKKERSFALVVAWNFNLTVQIISACIYSNLIIAYCISHYQKRVLRTFKQFDVVKLINLFKKLHIMCMFIASNEPLIFCYSYEEMEVSEIGKSEKGWLFSFA